MGADAHVGDPKNQVTFLESFLTPFEVNNIFSVCQVVF